MTSTPVFSKGVTPRLLNKSSTVYNGGASTFGRMSMNSSLEAQNIKHLIKDMVNQNKIKRYIFERSK